MISNNRKKQMPPRDLNQLSYIIRQERERAGLSTRKLAAEADLTPSTVQRIESGLIASPKPDHLQRIAAALGIDAEELYAAVGYLATAGLPALRPYLRAKYGLADETAGRIEGYVQALRDQQQPSKENDHGSEGDENP
jgi:transcriptional regulator with XRE-family HTH domain